METIDMMIRNAHTLANAPIDWSPAAGPIWLAGMVITWAVIGGLAGWSEVRRSR